MKLSPQAAEIVVQAALQVLPWVAQAPQVGEEEERRAIVREAVRLVLAILEEVDKYTWSSVSTREDQDGP